MHINTPLIPTSPGPNRRRFIKAALGTSLLLSFLQAQFMPQLHGFDHVGTTLSRRLQDAELVVIGTLDQVPLETPENRNQSLLAKIKIERTFKGPAELKEVNLAFQRYGGTLGIYGHPNNGGRHIWFLKKTQKEDYVRVEGKASYTVPLPDYVNQVSEDAIRDIQKIMEVETLISESKPPTTEMIEQLFNHPSSNLKTYAVSLMGQHDPLKHLNYFKEALQKSGHYLYVLAAAIGKLPPEKSVPFLLEDLAPQTGSYVDFPTLSAPIKMLQSICEKSPLPEPMALEVRKVMIQRYKKDGRNYDRFSTSYGHDPVLAVLATVADETCVSTFQEAFQNCFRANNVVDDGTRAFEVDSRLDPALDEGAVAGLWKVLGAKALPALRQHLPYSRGAIEKILSEHGNEEDFKLLIEKFSDQKTGENFELYNGLIKMAERAGFKAEPWMNFDKYQVPAGVPEQWKSWWSAHQKEIRFTPEKRPKDRRHLQ